MTKSQPRTATKTKSKNHKLGRGSKNKKRKQTNLFVSGTITITEDGVLTIDLGTISTFRGGPAIWLVNNLDNSTHTVSIDPGKITNEDGDLMNPFSFNDVLRTRPLKKTGWGAIVATTDEMKAPTLYKYTIEATGRIQPLDPDLDVANPPSIRYGGSRR